MTNDKLNRGLDLDYEIQILRDLLVDGKWDHALLRITLMEALRWRSVRNHEYSILSDEQLLQIAAIVKSALKMRLVMALTEFQQL